MVDVCFFKNTIFSNASGFSLSHNRVVELAQHPTLPPPFLVAQQRLIACLAGKNVNQCKVLISAN